MPAERPRRGRKRDPVEPGEPGESYVAALRRWPDEIARITDTELARRIGVSRVTELLQNRARWQATPALLKHARRIIEVCGGEPADVANWTNYHQQVAAYPVTGGQLPTPPSPMRSATTADDTTSANVADAGADVALATADPTSDRPRRPRLRWAARVAISTVVFGFLSWQLANEIDPRPWRMLFSAAVVLVAPLACLTVLTVLMAVAGPRLDDVSRRHQERSFRANVPDTWPLYAAYALVLGLLWSNLFDMAWLSTEIKVLITGLVVIAVVRVAQLQVRDVTTLDTAWPPTITPEALTFRRAATRLRDQLTADQPADEAQRQQAESVLAAFAAVRAELTDRSHMTWRQWLAQGPTRDPLPSVAVGMLVGVVAFACAGLVFAPWRDDTVRMVLGTLVIVAVATGLAVVALTVSFHAQRRYDRRLADELLARESELRPLMIPS